MGPPYYPPAVQRADDLRRRGEISWAEYGRMLRGALASPAYWSVFMKDFSRRVRDRQGRLLSLRDVGETAPGD